MYLQHGGHIVVCGIGIFLMTEFTIVISGKRCSVFKAILLVHHRKSGFHGFTSMILKVLNMQLIYILAKRHHNLKVNTGFFIRTGPIDGYLFEAWRSLISGVNLCVLPDHKPTLPNVKKLKMN